ncbi:MAG: hypothetical protein IKI57_01810 [Clostridia bacterium]|nr:hypothetical protein [Clostridia bacterium]
MDENFEDLNYKLRLMSEGEENLKIDSEIKEKQKESIIDVSQWWGFEFAGYGGYCINDRKELYSYTYYHRHPQTNINPNYIKLVKVLSDDEYNQILDFIEKTIENEYDPKMIKDAGYEITINYNGVYKQIINYMDIHDNIKNLIKSFINPNNEQKPE